MIEKIKKVILGEKHKNYKKTVEYAKKLSQLITGEDNDKLLKQFKRRVDDEYFKQIKEITTQVTPAVCKNLMDVAYRIPNSTSVSKSFSVKSETEKDKLVSKLSEIAGKFWGSNSVDDFMSTIFIDKNYIDPNSFLVLEWSNFDPIRENAQPYPFLVSSEMAVDYRYINNILQYLIILQTKDKLERYTYYDKNGAMVLQQIERDDKPLENTEVTLNEVRYIYVGQKWFIVSEYVYNLENIPVIQLGFKRNLNDIELFNSPLEPAICYLMKTINSTIELDLAMACHAFPQKFQYDKPCPNKDCKDGVLTSGKGKCPTCKGEGTMVHTTSMDSVKFKIPQGEIDPNQIIDLQRLIHYEYPPVEGLKFMDDYIDKLTVKCQQAIFNSDVYSKKQISDTATGQNIDQNNVNISLRPFAVHYSNVWEWVYMMISYITEIDVKAVMSIAKDLKFQTKEDKIAELKAAKDAGANPEIIQQIEDEIMRIDYEDQPAEFRKYLIKRQLKPFQALSEQAKIALFATLKPDNYYKVLYQFFDEIMQGIELVYPDFYKMKYEKQLEILKEDTNKFIKENIVVIEVPKL